MDPYDWRPLAACLMFAAVVLWTAFAWLLREINAIPMPDDADFLMEIQVAKDLDKRRAAIAEMKARDAA
jgi:hypothetical protein